MPGSTPDVLLEWGPQGLDALLAAGCRTIVVADVLRFTTAVDVACGRGAAVTPLVWDGDEAEAEAAAARVGARLAARGLPDGDTSRPSLSPVSLRTLQRGDHLAVRSPNGAATSVRAAAAGATVLAACLRNATAVAEAISAFPVGLVPAGERWSDGTLRPAVEDLWGVAAVARSLVRPAAPTSAGPGLGQIFEALSGGQPGFTMGFGGGPPPAPGRTRSASPEVEAAVRSLPDDLAEALPRTVSGRELVERGWGLDVEVAAALDVSRSVPELVAGTFRARAR